VYVTEIMLVGQLPNKQQNINYKLVVTTSMLNVCMFFKKIIFNKQKHYVNIHIYIKTKILYKYVHNANKKIYTKLRPL